MSEETKTILREWPIWAKTVSLARSEKDKGVGDTIARTIGIVGGHKYREWFKRITGRECGCRERQDNLNKLFPYTP